MPEGRTLVVTGSWSPEAAEILARGRVDGLWLNYARGFAEPDLEFLRAWPVRRLVVLDRTLEDLSPLARLADTLEDVTIEVAPAGLLDLRRFPYLVGLAAQWSLIRPTIHRALALQDLTVIDFVERDLRPFVENAALHQLVLKNSPRLESLDGLEKLRQLVALRIGLARRLYDISSVERAGPTLREFGIELCNRVGSLDGIEHLLNLEKLSISDCGRIESLVPLRLLLNLQVVHAWGSTLVEDGDLSPLVGLPLLRELRMRDRRNYRPRVSEIQKSIGWRP